MSFVYSKVPHYLVAEEFNTEIRKRMKNLNSSKSAITLVSLDFDNFNYVNDLFSYEIGDLVLQRITEQFASQLHGNEIFSKIHADHFLFCVDLSSSVEIIQHFLKITVFTDTFAGILPPHYGLVASGGIITVQDDSVSLSSLFDKINNARKKAKGNISSTFRFYDKKMDDEVRWQKIVTCMMEAALKNHELEMYLQPKVLLKSGNIVGAEALVRWNSPEYGLIPPDRFIPIMEQNGFICQLDFYMLNEACVFLKKCFADGTSPLPISVNFSRAHLTTENLVEKIFQTVNGMGISTNLIEIEFTESLSTEGIERMFEVVTDLKVMGFKVSLDDFGSAYSSLSCLKDLPFDIIKIDKGFLNATTDTNKGKIVISKVVELIKSLRMLSVMEGVENAEQLDFLQKLSCDIGQGYYYAKPLPACAYVEYLANGSVLPDIQQYVVEQTKKEEKSYLHVIPQEFQMDNWELYTLGKNIDMGLMKGYLDGEATVQYVNDRALEYLGYTRQEFREEFNNSIVAFTHPEDAIIVQKNAEQLVLNGKPLEFQTRAIRKDGKVIVLQGRSSCVIDNKGRPVGLYAFQDVTEELERMAAMKKTLNEKMENLQVSEERYRLIVDQSDDIMFDWDFTLDSIMFSGKYRVLFGEDPLNDNVTVNPAIRDMIHPDDRKEFELWITNTYRKSGTSQSYYRIKNVYGEYIRIRCRSTAICDDTKNPLRAVGVFSAVMA